MSRVESSTYYRVSQTPELLGDLARELVECKQTAGEIFSMYVPYEENVANIVESQLKTAHRVEGYNPVANCLDMAYDLAQAPGHVIGLEDLHHPIDVLTAGVRIEESQNVPESCRQITMIDKLIVIGTAEQTIANLKNGQAKIPHIKTIDCIIDTIDGLLKIPEEIKELRNPRIRQGN